MHQAKSTGHFLRSTRDISKLRRENKKYNALLQPGLNQTYMRESKRRIFEPIHNKSHLLTLNDHLTTKKTISLSPKFNSPSLEN